MSFLEIAVVLVGVLVAASRAPLVVAPQASLDWYERLVRSDAALRGVAALLGVLGVALIFLSRGERDARLGLLTLLGAILALGALWLLAWPASYREIALAFFDFIRSSADRVLVRGLGLLGVAVGLALVYAGIYAL